MDPRQDVFKTFEVPDPIRIRKVVEGIRFHFGSLQGLSVLECGVARGGLVDLLRNEGARCCGVDIHSRPGMEGIEFQQADLNEGIPRFPTMFDVIFAGEVMEHLVDDALFVRSARDQINPNGLLILTVPNLVFSVNRVRMLFGATPMFAYAPFHYHIYTRRTLTDLLEREGLSILAFRSSHLLFSTRRSRLGRIFEIGGDFFPSFGAHLIAFARKG